MANRKVAKVPSKPKPENALSAKMLAASIVVKHQRRIDIDRLVEETVAQKLGSVPSTWPMLSSGSATGSR